MTGSYLDRAGTSSRNPPRNQVAFYNPAFISGPPSEKFAVAPARTRCRPRPSPTRASWRDLLWGDGHVVALLATDAGPLDELLRIAESANLVPFLPR